MPMKQRMEQAGQGKDTSVQAADVVGVVLHAGSAAARRCPGCCGSSMLAFQRWNSNREQTVGLAGSGPLLVVVDRVLVVLLSLLLQYYAVLLLLFSLPLFQLGVAEVAHPAVVKEKII